MNPVGGWTLEVVVTNHSRSHDPLYSSACAVMPGGVSSPVRAFGSVGGTPLYFRRGSGAYFETEDGRRLLDFVGSWGPLILGHAHPEVISAVQARCADGLSFGAPTRVETELAEAVVRLAPAADKVRFVSSGTEATMSALRLARGVTGRSRFLKFEGCYHGHGDAFLVSAGSGLATSGISSSAGVPQTVVDQTEVLPLADVAKLNTWFDNVGDQAAAVFFEGVPGNAGLLEQTSEWLETLQRRCQQHGVLLVVDEVMTGFRLAPGGACERYGIEADIVTYGKVIGGGMPVGAYAASPEVMAHVAPEGPVYQAGTLSGNPVAMTAGLATLQVLEREDGWRRLEALGQHWTKRVTEVLARSGAPVSFRGIGSMFWFCFDSVEAPRSFSGIPTSGAGRYARFFSALIERGVYFAPSAYEVGFLNLAMTEADLDQAAEAVEYALGAAYNL